MNYEVYRNTTLGNTLQECLDDLIHTNQISERLANRVLKEFDKSINNALASRVKTRYYFKGTLNTYRFCDNVWTLLFKQIEFRETQQEKLIAHNVKFVACDGKISINATLNGSLKKQQDADVKEESKKAVKLYASVCVERMPVITCDMNDLEKRYSNLINEINIRRSYLSNHELRHLKDIELAKKKKKDEDSENMIIETALDYEEKCLNQLKAIKFSERKLSDDYDKKLIGMNQSTDKRNIAELQNVDYILDKKLILLVNEDNTSNWGLPKAEWSITDTSLRQTAERIIKSLNDKLEVEFLGNAPFAVYKTNKDQNTIEKCYFFKAQYKKGAQFLASSKSSSDFVWIRKNELKDFINDKKYLECLGNFILDF